MQNEHNEVSWDEFIKIYVYQLMKKKCRLFAWFCCICFMDSLFFQEPFLIARHLRKTWRGGDLFFVGQWEQWKYTWVVEFYGG